MHAIKQRTVDFPAFALRTCSQAHSRDNQLSGVYEQRSPETPARIGIIAANMVDFRDPESPPA